MLAKVSRYAENMCIHERQVHYYLCDVYVCKEILFFEGEQWLTGRPMGLIFN